MSATHYDTAHLVRELADKEPQQTPHDEWVKQKIAKARADHRPVLTIAEAKRRLHNRLSCLECV